MFALLKVNFPVFDWVYGFYLGFISRLFLIKLIGFTIPFKWPKWDRLSQASVISSVLLFYPGGTAKSWLVLVGFYGELASIGVIPWSLKELPPQFLDFC